MKKSGSTISGIFSGILFALFLWLTRNILIAFGVAFVGFIVCVLTFAPQKKKVEYIIEGITCDDLEQIIKEGRQQVRRIEDSGLDITNKNVRMKVLFICDIANNIFDDFKKDPKDIKASRKFLNYYLDTTEKIIKRYVDLSGEYMLTDEAKSTLKKVENMLDDIKDLFQKQKQKLLEDDFFDLDTEIKILETTIKSEGV